MSSQPSTMAPSVVAGPPSIPPSAAQCPWAESQGTQEHHFPDSPPTTGFQTISSISSRKTPPGGFKGGITSTLDRFRGKLNNMDPVKLAYLRTSFIFAVSVLVTWAPSSINRVYTLIYPDRVSFGLNMASAVVLPLQGVWNTVIYFTTSWAIVREEIQSHWHESRWTTRFGHSDRLEIPSARPRFGVMDEACGHLGGDWRQDTGDEQGLEMTRPPPARLSDRSE